jgi:phosphohistidine phosphatase
MNSSPITRSISLLRHAKSDWEKSGLDDHDRPLNARGRRSAPLVAKYIEQHEIGIDVILASTALRAQQTLDLLIATWKGRPPTIFSTQNLYLATPQVILREISKLDDQWNSVLVIGHNPGLADLASRLAETSLEYPTACLAVFCLELSSWTQLTGAATPIARLTHYCRPRELE